MPQLNSYLAGEAIAVVLIFCLNAATSIEFIRASRELLAQGQPRTPRRLRRQDQTEIKSVARRTARVGKQAL